MSMRRATLALLALAAWPTAPAEAGSRCAAATGWPAVARSARVIVVESEGEITACWRSTGRLTRYAQGPASSFDSPTVQSVTVAGRFVAFGFSVPSFSRGSATGSIVVIDARRGRVVAEDPGASSGDVQRQLLTALHLNQAGHYVARIDATASGDPRPGVPPPAPTSRLQARDRSGVRTLAPAPLASLGRLRLRGERVTFVRDGVAREAILR
jgi:hypothetical protein